MRSHFKLIPDFILPGLERATYGPHLMWEDKNHGSFKISRIHQSSELWSDDCIAVYKAWSLKKKLWRSSDPKNVTKAKHRLITALRRNPVIEVLKREEVYYRFRFISDCLSEGHYVRSEKRTLMQERRNFKVISGSMELHEEPCTNDKNSLQDLTSNTRKDGGIYHVTFPSDGTENDYCKGPNTPGEHCTPVVDSFELLLQCPMEHAMWNDEKNPCEIMLDNSFLSNESCLWQGAHLNP